MARSADRAALWKPNFLKFVWSLGILFGFFAPNMSQAANRSFEKRIEVEVPARGLTGRPPRRKVSIDFNLPKSFKVIRNNEHGARIINRNLGGLTEVTHSYQELPNGVRLTWELKNEHITPATGRRAIFVLGLDGIQISPPALSKQYLALRNRFLNDFYYQGIVAERISADRTYAKFADQTIYLGQALAVFSTEAAIRRQGNQPLGDCLQKVSEMLDALEQLELDGNGKYGGNRLTPNGFFVRDNVQGSDDRRLHGKFKRVDSDWSAKAENDSPSGDQIFGLLTGLYCVVKFSGDSNLVERAQKVSARLYDYAHRNHFILKSPNGRATRRGSDVRWLASLLHGMNYSITGNDRFDSATISISGVEMKLKSVAGFWDSRTTAKEAERLIGRSFKLPLLNEEVELHSFALHILLMSLAPSDVWNQTELENAAVKANHHLSVLLYCLSHNSLPNTFDEDEINKILKLCPIEGPSASVDAKTGWRRDSRWIRCTNIFDPNDSSDQFNGLDWMILHNISELLYAGI